jgi:hypothetical protein
MKPPKSDDDEQTRHPCREQLRPEIVIGFVSKRARTVAEIR